MQYNGAFAELFGNFMLWQSFKCEVNTNFAIRKGK